MMISVVVLVRLVYSASALMLFLLCMAAWRRRKRASGAGLVSLLTLSAAIYCFGYAEEISQTTFHGAWFWMHFDFLGIPWLPFLWVVLVRKQLQLRSRFGIFLVIPVLTFLAQWTSSWHSFFYRSVEFVSRPPFWIILTHRGPLDYLFLLYLYGAFLYGIWMYVAHYRSKSNLLSKQSLLFAFSAVPPLVGFPLGVFGMSPWNIDIVPFLLTISAVWAYYAIVWLECFDLVPMARSLVFTGMRDAALVTDLSFRLIDLNPAAHQLLAVLGGFRVGQDITTGHKDLMPLRQLFLDPVHSLEIEMTIEAELRYFELRALPLRAAGRQYGWAVLLADITARARLLHDLRRDAQTDALTGVANRRRFTTAIETEYERSNRHHFTFCVMIVDLDHFKSINDEGGHTAGDKVLTAVAVHILSCLRRIDLLCRYGGDEFAILLPETNADDALEIAERIRRAVAEISIDLGEKRIVPSVSIGVAASDPARNSDWGQLLDEADQALYRGKARGRNRVAIWNEIMTSVAAGASEENEIAS
jgi:diguanylate cyclase (GGDEF)-like protein